MSIASEITRLQNAKAALKESIEAKGVTVEDSAKLDEYPTLVDSIQSGGSGEIEEKDVNFYDYDGKRLYSYTKNEFLALTEMPNLPNHQNIGLISEEWCFTFEYAINYVSRHGILEVGAFYHPSDNKCHIIIDVEYTDINMKLRLYGNNASCTIDWGDGTIETKTLDNLGTTNYHTYSNKGKYDISFYSNSEFGIGGGNSCIIADVNYDNNEGNSLLNNEIKYIYLTNCKCYTQSLNSLYATIVFSNSVAIDNNCLTETILLRSRAKYIFSPVNVDGEIYYAKTAILLKSNPVIDCKYLNIYCIHKFYNATSLSHVNLSKIAIGGNITKYNSTDYNYLQTTLILPDTITNIRDSAFNSWMNLETITILNPIPPTLGSNAFKNNGQHITIYVPAESVEAYKTATNWSAYADKIQAIPTT